MPLPFLGTFIDTRVEWPKAMSEESSTADAGTEARMELDPDTLHEGDSGYALDCPECGATVTLPQIIEEGRCTGSLDADTTEVEGDGEELKEPACTAVLSLELVWES